MGLSAHRPGNSPLARFVWRLRREGALSPGFADLDPRVYPEDVVWDWDPANPYGVEPNGNDLQRKAPTSQPPDFDAGAASKQRIERGDAYVEFSAGIDEIDPVSHVAGLSEIPKKCPDPCTDTDPSLTDI